MDADEFSVSIVVVQTEIEYILIEAWSRKIVSDRMNKFERTVEMELVVRWILNAYSVERQISYVFDSWG